MNPNVTDQIIKLVKELHVKRRTARRVRARCSIVGMRHPIKQKEQQRSNRTRSEGIGISPFLKN